MFNVQFGEQILDAASLEYHGAECIRESCLAWAKRMGEQSKDGGAPDAVCTALRTEMARTPQPNVASRCPDSFNDRHYCARTWL